MMTGEDHGELEHVNRDACDDVGWCILLKRRREIQSQQGVSSSGQGS